MRRLALVMPFVFLLAAHLRAQAPDGQTGAGATPVTLGGLLQVQAEAGDRGDTRFSDDHDRLYLRRARLNASGTLGGRFDFRLEADFAGGLAGSSDLRGQLTDAYVDWKGVGGKGAARVRVGQFKTPFGHEQLFADPRLPTIERSLANDRLTLGRQLGVQVHGELIRERLTYAVGAFNGNGANSNFNDDDRFLVAARLGGVPWRARLGAEEASFSVAVDGYASTDHGVEVAEELGFEGALFAGERRGLGVDGQLEAGRLTVAAEYLAAAWEPDSGRPRRRLESEGWYLQAAWFLVPRRLQVLLKAESFDPRRDQDDDETLTGVAGVNWLLAGHDLKLMLNYQRVRDDRATAEQDKLLARLQVAF